MILKLIQGGGERNPHLFIKNRVFIIAYLNFCHLPSTLSPCDAIHLEDVFFHSSKQFLNSSILMPFSASAVFWFHLFHIGKRFPFEDFTHPGKQNIHLGHDWVNTEHSEWGIVPFLGKNCWKLSTVWAGVLVNHPSRNGQMCWVFKKKKKLRSNTACHNTTSWCTDTDRSLEHSPIREACTTRGLPSGR